MKIITKTIPTMGLAAMMTFMSQPAYAKENVQDTNKKNVKEETTLEMEFNKESSLKNSLNKVFNQSLKNVQYDQTKVNADNEKVLVYKADGFSIEIEKLDIEKEGQQIAKASLKKENDIEAVVETKDVAIHVKDKEAPKISGPEKVEITEDEEFNLSEKLIGSDNKDKDVEVEIDGEVETDKNGEYTVYATATDKNGNSTSKEITVVVNVNGNEEKIKTSSFHQKIADAALAQLGRTQDCTMLATNSLAAVGINFHGWPMDYARLGEWTKNPVPGDLIIYQGHIAVYVGNGQAVHGGWYGTQTVLSSVQCSNALIGYIHVNQ